MNTNVEEKIEQLIKKSPSILMQIMWDVIYANPHRWSSRPCRTCSFITMLTGVDFGCSRYAKEHAESPINLPRNATET